ncbi:MAG: hypothetical protein JO345_13975 [Streptosporangiaceae bacterium]|nr:hypothetical protein [Streptosporangiaceae bacterium]
MTSVAVLAVAVALPSVLGMVLLRRQFTVITVRGGSMLPTLYPGDRVLIRHGIGRRLQVGALIVFRPPMVSSPSRLLWPLTPGVTRNGWVIKRVAALPGAAVPEAMLRATGGMPVVPSGMLLVSADNRDGSDSREWGFIPADNVLGPVVRRIAALR